ncbi:uracil-DNA glycosylase, partial [Escherichia coli]
FGCNHFVLANQWLEQRGEKPIDWMPVLPAESE